MTRHCPREQEVLDAIDTHLGDALSAHVASCDPCTDLVNVAHAILDDVNIMANAAPIPSSGGVWWRIERRAREEAERKALHTVSVVQVSTVGVVAMLAIVLLGGLATIRGWITDLAIPMQLASWSAPVLLGLATLVILTPVAIYFAVSE
jgi:hypothetical protein